MLKEAAAKGKFIHEGWRQRKDKTLFWGSIIITALDDQASAGDSVIIIATAQHLDALAKRLTKQGFNLEPYQWPDEKLFNEFISGLMHLAQMNNRKVRAVGEMVAVLWENGYSDATVQLESLWNYQR